jgi:hypothetical protein
LRNLGLRKWNSITWNRPSDPDKQQLLESGIVSRETALAGLKTTLRMNDIQLGLRNITEHRLCLAVAGGVWLPAM